MTTNEKRTHSRPAVSRLLNARYCLPEWEADVAAEALGFVSAAQVMRMAQQLRNNQEAVARWVQVAPQDVNYSLLS
jgi:hypothetical protein